MSDTIVADWRLDMTFTAESAICDCGSPMEKFAFGLGSAWRCGSCAVIVTPSGGRPRPEPVAPEGAISTVGALIQALSKFDSDTRIVANVEYESPISDLTWGHRNEDRWLMEVVDLESRVVLQLGGEKIR